MCIIFLNMNCSLFPLFQVNKRVSCGKNDRSSEGADRMKGIPGREGEKGQKGEPGRRGPEGFPGNSVKVRKA